MDARADADGRDAQPVRDGRRELVGHQLQHDGEGARLLDGERVREHRSCLVAVLALDAGLAAHAVLGLGRPADVAHDRDAGTHERLDDPAAAHAALDLDGPGARLAHEAAGVLERLLDRGIGQEGHVAHDERPLGAPDHGLGVVEHLVDGHAHRRFVAQHHLAQRVTDQDHGHARLVHDLRGGVVVGGEHRDALPVGMHPGDVGDGQSTLWRGGTHAWMMHPRRQGRARDPGRVAGPACVADRYGV